MDDHRIDLIARSLAAGTSRRALLRTLVGVAVGGTLGLTGHAAGAAKPAKVGICRWDKDVGSYTYIQVDARAVPAHEKHGDETHVDLMTDVSNCGACGSACYEGLECCNGMCTDSASWYVDPANCGACGNACPSGNACCDGECIDVQTDRENCGGCKNRCPPDGYCDKGSCQRLCGGEGGEICPGACYVTCIECGCFNCGPFGQGCGSYVEFCCPDGDPEGCLGLRPCPTNTQRFIELR